MGTAYQIHDQSACYYMTFQVIDWVDVFSRKRYRDIIIDSFKFCQKNKGLKLWAYVIMTNHIHVIMSSEENNSSDIIHDFKRHTSSKILKSIKEEPESRRDWMLKRFEFAASKNKRNGKHQFWIHENHAIQIESKKFMRQKWLIFMKIQ